MIFNLNGEGVQKATLTKGQTTVNINNSDITTNSILSFYTSIYGVNPTAVQVSAGRVTLTFETQQTDMIVGVRIDG